MKAISGSLFSLEVLGDLAGDRDRGGVLCRLAAHALAALGPASSPRHIADRLARPLATLACMDDSVVDDAGEFVVLRGADDAVIVVGAWGADIRRLREQSRPLTPRTARWWIGVNGRQLVVIDARTAYTRRSTVVDLELLGEDLDGAAAVAALLERSGSGRLLGAAAAALRSDTHRIAVSRTLTSGVETALLRLTEGLLGRRQRSGLLDAAMAEALTVVYRILFLHFAEARGLVPQWHPTYRRSYTIESLRDVVERGGRTGVWDAVQAISRLAHRGCRAGALRVTPFNGRLFAPTSAPTADTARINDAAAAEAVLALTTRSGERGRARISYTDLGVEQLGAVYEGVLDFTAVRDGAVVRLERTGRRKATGTFYTPRSMTEYLVRRTLAPLVRDAAPERVLSVRLVDPAMGSGAFLVAACRYLADAYERALLRDGSIAADDVSPADRAGFRRAVAQKCLYGVDRNPTAVQLARLSLWLCTLAADRPLTFLDHHLRTGNSLVGVSPQDVRRQPPVSSGFTRRPLPLFGDDDLHASLASTVHQRLTLANTPDDVVEAVHEKERVLAALDRSGAPLGTWRALCDAWCAAWFTRDGMTPQLWGALEQSLAGRPSGLPPDIERRWREALEETARRERAFHWDLEFPEVFFDESGSPLASPGFDAVLGNPPWDMLRGTEAAPLSAFARQSGCYVCHGDGHLNLYQLFAERMLKLTRAAGRFGLLMPAGLIADHGSADLRRVLFDQCRIDALLGFDNRAAIFPIHRGIKFTLITGTRDAASPALPARFGLISADVLDDVPDEGVPPDAVHVPLSLIRDFSGEPLAVPEIACDADRAILAGVLARIPLLAADDGWGARFGRELNATDDKPLFAASGLPVLEGKLIAPFEVDAERATAFISSADAERALGGRPFARPRLGYREVAASSNRLTLIAAIIPAMSVTTHTIFCLKTSLPAEAQWFLCGVFNSLVANYLIRLRGGTHVPAAVIHRLPVPCPPMGDSRVRDIARLAERMSHRKTLEDEAELNARAADLYQIDAPDLTHVLSTFPLVEDGLKSAIAAAFSSLSSAI
ncbi:MAG TPA: N-6 DNA methylase [Vicinamibacterales bacterium]|nr:N-6 DNA methylase [Vicinamibacterales bacterium]